MASVGGHTVVYRWEPGRIMGSIKPQTAHCMIWALLCFPVLLSAQNVPATMFEGTWCGIADINPDAGLPVTVRIKTQGDADSLRVAL